MNLPKEALPNLGNGRVVVFLKLVREFRRFRNGDSILTVQIVAFHGAFVGG